MRSSGAGMEVWGRGEKQGLGQHWWRHLLAPSCPQIPRRGPALGDHAEAERLGPA